MSTSTIGAVLGLISALGVVLVGARLLALRPPSMLERIAPFVPATPRTRALGSPLPTVGQILTGLARPLLGTSREGVDVRLRRSGGIRLEELRIAQMTAIGIGAVAGVGAGVMGCVRGANPLCLPLLLGLGALAGAILVDQWLTHRIRRRQQAISHELPVVVELLAFAVAAGEAPAQAIERVCRSVGGELAAELQACLAEMRGGLALDLALTSMAGRCGNPDVERFADACVVALERGSPLAEVLRAQASDARACDRRVLMESASRKEVAMLIPVVFLILPTVVLIAIFPGIQGLQLVIHS